MRITFSYSQRSFLKSIWVRLDRVLNMPGSSRSLSVICQSLLLILVYYSASIGLLFFNQIFVHKYRAPFLTATFHFIIKFAFAALYRGGRARCRTAKSDKKISWKVYLTKLMPCGAAGALDIGLSNWSYEFITISLYVMTKSSATVFILFFAILLGVEKPRGSIALTVLLISVGLFLFTYHSTHFDATGFIIVICASMLSGLRWSLTQLFLQKEEMGLSHPVDMMYHVQPIMVVFLIPLLVFVEGDAVSTSHFIFNYHEFNDVMAFCGGLLASGTLAIFLELSEFAVIGYTSALTFNIAGIVKEIITLLFAALFKGDEVSAINALGAALCVMAIVVHVFFKFRSESLERRRTKSGNETNNASRLPSNISLNNRGNDARYSDTQSLISSPSSARGGMLRRFLTGAGPGHHLRTPEVRRAAKHRSMMADDGGADSDDSTEAFARPTSAIASLREKLTGASRYSMLSGGKGTTSDNNNVRDKYDPLAFTSQPPQPEIMPWRLPGKKESDFESRKAFAAVLEHR